MSLALSTIIGLGLEVAAPASLLKDAAAGAINADLFAPISARKDVVAGAASAHFRRGCIDSRAGSKVVILSALQVIC